MEKIKKFALPLLLGIFVSTCMAGDFIILPQFEQPVRSIGVGLASINGKYYAAYTPHAHTDVHFMYSEDGVHFKETAKTPTDGYGGASIAAYHGHLYLAFQGGDKDHSLCLVEVTLNSVGQPTGVGTIMRSIQSSENYPSLVGTDAGLFITYLGNGNGHPVIGRVNVP